MEDLMIEFVERPPAPGLPEERRALLETATNGHAIVIALNGRPRPPRPEHAPQVARDAGPRAALQAQHGHVLPHLLG